jgi:hypothetical protein
VTAGDDLARRFLLEALVGIGGNAEIIKTFDPPQGPGEIVHLVHSLWEEGQKDRVRILLESESVVASVDPSVQETRRKYLARLER